MRFRTCLLRAALAGVCLAAWSGVAAAQTGRVGGVIKDEGDQPIKGATIRAENPDASPNSFTAVTDEKGRFSIIGLRRGDWNFTVEAAGFAPQSRRMSVQTIGQPNAPLTMNLKKGGAATPPGVLGGVNAKDLQGDLAAADQLYNAQQWDAAIAAYRAILAKAPAVTVINLQIAAAYRSKKDYDSALVAYGELLKTDPTNEKAKVGIGMTNLEKGDMKAAEEGLQAAAEAGSASREVYYTLGEVKFAKGETSDAAKWYQKAADTDPAWGKPWFKLGLVAVNKGDKDSATKMMEKVIVVDPMSPEAAQAKAIIEQLKK